MQNLEPSDLYMRFQIQLKHHSGHLQTRRCTSVPLRKKLCNFLKAILSFKYLFITFRELVLAPISFVFPGITETRM